jgi:signal transduction histidine kinase
LDLLSILPYAELLVFSLVAGAAVRQWWRHRSRPAALLALAFLSIAAAFLWGRLVPVGTPGWLGRLRPFDFALFAAFPWLLAAFACSFEGRIPRALRVAAVPVVALGVWALVLPPFGAGDLPPAEHRQLYVDLFAVVWTGLSVATAWHLWHAGGEHRATRSRMRLMAGGLLVMNVSLLASARYHSTPSVRVLTVLAALLAAGLFLAGFAPPWPLRAWWRQRSGGSVRAMQEALIGAATPREIAAAVAPAVASLLGGGVAIVTDRGEVLGAHGIGDEDIADAVVRLAIDQPLDAGTQAFRVDRAWLVLRTTPYLPLFGREELDLVRSFSLQLRLALERAELFEAHLRSQQDADRASAELEATLIGLAHDLRSPTAAINGFAALLGQVDSAEQRAEIIGHIQASSDYIDGLIRAIMEFAGVGRTQLEVEPVDLSATLRAVTERVAVRHPAATVRSEGALPMLLANPLRIAQLLDNLVWNAVRHGGRDDITVTVTSTTTADGFTLSVADDGRGIHADDHERVFALFQRGQGASRDGSGVGLGIVRRIVESYGGRITLAPESGEGVCFLVELPAAMLMDDRSAAPRTTSPRPQGRAPWLLGERRQLAGFDRLPEAEHVGEVDRLLDE